MLARDGVVPARRTASLLPVAVAEPSNPILHPPSQPLVVVRHDVADLSSSVASRGISIAHYSGGKPRLISHANNSPTTRAIASYRDTAGGPGRSRKEVGSE